MKRFNYQLPLILILFFSLTRLSAHGPVHEAIIELTREIESHPDSIFLYFERGALYEIDEDYDAAISDFERVLTMDSSIHAAIFQLANINYKKRDWLRTNIYINSYIGLQPDQASGYQLRGLLNTNRGEVKAAITDFQKVIELKGTRIVPADILQLSDLLNIHHPRQAIQNLEYGLDFLPANISLQAKLIDITMATGDYEKTFNHIRQILSITPRKEFWLLKEAEVYEAVGNCEKAREIYQNCLAEISSLKRKSRQTEFVRNIQQQALFALRFL